MLPVSIQQLSKRFGSAPVLSDVSLEIAPGELFFLLGPSGSGKTTLLRHLAGFYTPDAGQIFFGEKEVTQTPPHQRNTAMMFQSYALFPHLSVEDNLAFGLKERKVDPDEIDTRVAEALAMVQMTDYGQRRVTELSGGQQQRIALARALIVRPDILLLDEPLSNLDTRLRLEMREEIRRLCKEHQVTAIYVTHDQKEALSIADRLGVMADGQLLQVGTPQQMYRHPQSQFVASFLGETNFITGVIERETSRDHLWSVKTNVGQFWGRHTETDWTPKPGEAVTLSIRPESWAIVPFKEIRNSVQGTIERAIYLGDMAQYEINVPGHGLIRLGQTNPRVLHPMDDSVYAVAVDPDDVVILRK